MVRLLCALALVAFPLEVLAQPKASRQKLMADFDAMKSQAAKIQVSRPKLANGAAVVAPNTKFNLTVPVDNNPCQLGVKIWGELAATSQCVALTKHRWQRKERFYLCFEAAVPVNIYLIQLYEGGTTNDAQSRVVAPDEMFPETLRTFYPGDSRRYPYMIELDDNEHDEVMQIVVTRVDAGLPLNTGNTLGSPGAGGASSGGVDGPGGSIKASKQLVQQIARSGQFKGASTKFNIIAPPIDTNPPESDQPDDVSYLAFSKGPVAVMTVTLRK